MSREYSVWVAMRTRCRCPTSQSYRDYGGRGIKVCARWDLFENFLADMGPRPSRLHSLDRRNNNGDYEPSNCRWATRKEQLRNTRANRLLTHNGLTLPVAEWAERLGINANTIRVRLWEGFTTEAALTPARYKSPDHTLTHEGQTLPVSAWAKRLNIKADTISARLSRGKTVEQALMPATRRGP